MAEDESRGLFQELISAWQPPENLRVPPSEPIKLWSSGGRTIYVDKDWGRPFRTRRSIATTARRITATFASKETWG